MRTGGHRRKSIIFFISFGACMVAIAIALDVGWILLSWRQVALLLFGILFFLLIITGLVLNTTFLIREIRRNEQHDAFINAVTHELKTPIASIRLYLETLKTRQVSDVERTGFYDVMLADTNRLLGTVEQILQAGRTGHRSRRLNVSTIELGDLIMECVDLTRKRYDLDERCVKYLEAPAPDMRVSGDQEELRVAFSNLLDNAVKYSNDKVDITVELLNLQDRNVAVRIVDRGIGIPRAQLKRIFKRFYRVPGSFTARIKGTGLGLSIVRATVEKHGGHVFAESPGLGRGSAFTIQLPKVDGNERKNSNRRR